MFVTHFTKQNFSFLCYTLIRVLMWLEKDDQEMILKGFITKKSVSLHSHTKPSSSFFCMSSQMLYKVAGIH